VGSVLGGSVVCAGVGAGGGGERGGVDAPPRHRPHPHPHPHPHPLTAAAGVLGPWPSVSLPPPLKRKQGTPCRCATAPGAPGLRRREDCLGITALPSPPPPYLTSLALAALPLPLPRTPSPPTHPTPRAPDSTALSKRLLALSSHAGGAGRTPNCN
jgi:hypothetical protein